MRPACNRGFSACYSAASGPVTIGAPSANGVRQRFGRKDVLPADQANQSTV